MKKFLLVALVSCLTSLGFAQNAVVDRMNSSAKVLNEIMAAPDKGIPSNILEHAKCIAVVPHMIKGAFIWGAENGRGVATCRTSDGWSAPAFFAVTGGSFGWQIGIQGTDLVMVFQDDQGMQKLLSSKFKLGADASVAAGPVGRHAAAGTSWELNAAVLSYSRSKGIFAGLALNGVYIRPDVDSMTTYYEHPVSTHGVLLGAVAPPESAMPFLGAVHNAEVVAHSR